VTAHPRLTQTAAPYRYRRPLIVLAETGRGTPCSRPPRRTRGPSGPGTKMKRGEWPCRELPSYRERDADRDVQEPELMQLVRDG